MIRTIATLLLLCGGLAAAEDLYTDKVQPLLQQRCYECHGEKKQKHGLRLDSLEAMLKGGDEHGAAVVPGKPDESPIVRLCSLKRGEGSAMPPKGASLTPEQIGWLKDWITAGAKVPGAPAAKPKP